MNAEHAKYVKEYLNLLQDKINSGAGRHHLTVNKDGELELNILFSEDNVWQSVTFDPNSNKTAQEAIDELMADLKEAGYKNFK